MKRTRLARKTPLRAKTALRATDRLAPVSSRRKAANAVRRTVIAQLVAERGPWCQSPVHADGCTGQADDAHETLTRARGGSITAGENIVLLNRHCHSHAHANPVWAASVGLLRHSWDVPADDTTEDRPR